MKGLQLVSTLDGCTYGRCCAGNVENCARRLLLTLYSLENTQLSR